ncbi:2-oxoisovalerate dehydrogenase E1 subunit beta [Gloeocapsopsis dulcis]|uniref:2-oxoisovalerate dehydrogenase E1 subunit beta n=1 Tax=Gloeocapsopsis dulcis AAB1 = 1H9 TaxID=1433147 RepID=A0A6N8FUG1_9CHRO|nr:2-oxoisovalerate dehydrogenase E1 subunit beta [Gloeocapsopsis dulcis]MUL36760.1 2-oxoisovalerate dehydrogenase E1 subunit beta [Gloeocapsopsis dulcis AAB1 = 1H9]WNN91332.1 2-oxoisovalerate dehydrogenase [Gloeocapsopsis dulcis]
MTEIVFLVEDDIEGGYTARALGESIFTQASDLKTLREMVRDAVHCHFPDEQSRSKVINLFACNIKGTRGDRR